MTADTHEPCPNPRHTGDDKPPGAPVYCLACHDRTLAQLGRLGTLAAHLWTLPLHRFAPATPAGRTARTRLSAAPSPAPAFDLYDEILRWAVDWEDTFRDHAGHTPVNGPRYLYKSTGHLAAWLDTLLRQDFAQDFIDELHQRVHMLEHATGTDRLVHRLPIECPACHARGLRRDDGSDTVYCCACDRLYTWDDYLAFANAFAQSARFNNLTA